MTTATTDLFASAETPVQKGPKINQFNQYVLPDPVTGEKVALTRVTTFSKTLSDLYVVNLWQKRMTVHGLTLRPDLYALAAGMDPYDDREAMNKLADEAQAAAGAKVAANLGTAVHAFTEAIDRGETPTIPAPYRADVDAYRQALVAHGLQVVPDLIERTVFEPTYRVAGTLDRVIKTARGTLAIGDLKTGRDLRYGWTEIAVQLALYANATHVYDDDTRTWSLLPDIDLTEAYVFHLPVGQGRCDVYRVDVSEGWAACALCEQARQWRKHRRLAEVLSLNAGTPPPPASRWPSWAERITRAASRGELSTIWSEATLAGEWTTELEAAGRARLARLSELPAGS